MHESWSANASKDSGQTKEAVQAFCLQKFWCGVLLGVWLPAECDKLGTKPVCMYNAVKSIQCDQCFGQSSFQAEFLKTISCSQGQLSVLHSRIFCCCCVQNDWGGKQEV